MAIQYTWGFPALDVKLSEGEMTNVVTTVHWTLTGTEGDHTASTYGSLGVGEPTPEGFVDYELLTAAEVQSWVESAMGEEQLQSMYDGLVQQIETLKAPVTGTLPPPWTE